MSVAGNIGLPLFDSGFANLSLEYGTSEPTDRSVQHGDATALIQQGIEGVRVPAKPWGSPDVKSNIKFVATLVTTSAKTVTSTHSETTRNAKLRRSFSSEAQ